MLRALGLAAALCAVGCGDDTTTPATASIDLSQPAALTCGAVTCSGSCAACLPFGGGLCALPCKTSMPSSCSVGTCTPAASDGGTSVTFLGGSCAGFDGFCG
jgi:hypothetical protein